MFHSNKEIVRKNNVAKEHGKEEGKKGLNKKGFLIHEVLKLKYILSKT